MPHKSEFIEQLLVQILEMYELSEQQQIQEKLAANGIDMPQSTLSRWLKKLNVAKVGNHYKVIGTPSYSRIPILGIKAWPPNLLVLLTQEGHAMALATKIDRKLSHSGTEKTDPFYGVISTIAGDDTVLVIMQDKKSLSH